MTTTTASASIMDDIQRVAHQREVITAELAHLVAVAREQGQDIEDLAHAARVTPTTVYRWAAMAGSGDKVPAVDAMDAALEVLAGVVSPSALAVVATGRLASDRLAKARRVHQAIRGLSQAHGLYGEDRAIVALGATVATILLDHPHHHIPAVDLTKGMRGR